MAIESPLLTAESRKLSVITHKTFGRYGRERLLATASKPGDTCSLYY